MESKYRQSYVTHYQRVKTPLNIDEYTRLWGSKLMPENMIYRPVSVTVAMNPDVAYKLQVDATRKEWRKELCDGVRKMMEGPDHIEFTLRDDMGRDIKDIPVSRIFHVGRLYPHVLDNGVSRRAMTKKVKPGDNIQVPIGLSVNKKAHFDEWINKVQDEIVDAVSSSLGECATAKQVGQRLMLDDRNTIKKPILRTMRKGFNEILDVHCTVRDVDPKYLVNKMSEFVMSAIKDGVIHNKAKVHDWYHADRHERTASSSTIGQEVNELEIDDSITTNATKIKREYPHIRHLFSELVGAALQKNDIGKHVYYIVLRGGKKHRRRRHRHRKKVVAKNGPDQKVVVMTGKKRLYQKHPGRNYGLHDTDKKAYMRTLFKSHEMQGLHRYPGTLPYGDKVKSEDRGVEAVESNPYGLSSTGAPSLESVGVSLESVDTEMTSIESVYPDSLSFGTTERAPSIEPVRISSSKFSTSNPYGLESERSTNPHGLASVGSIAAQDEESLEDIEDDMPPALESVGSEFDDDEDDMDSMELLVEDVVEQDATPPPMIKSRGKQKKKPTETNIFDEVTQETSSSSSDHGGLPSLSSFKRQYGLASEEPKEISSGVQGKTYSKTTDDPVYGNAMKIMGHYYVLRHGRMMKAHRRRHHGHRKNHKRRVVVLTANKKVFGKVDTQEITELSDPIDVEEYVEPFVASSYQNDDGTVAFTTSDGKTHRILPDGTYYINGRKQALPVEKLVEQELSGEPVLMVLHQNKV